MKSLFFTALLFCIEIAASDYSCETGTEEQCVGIGEDASFYYCTENYKWEWSDDISLLGMKRSDAVTIAIPNSVLNDTTMILLGGCINDEQEINGFCTQLTSDVDFYIPATDEWKSSEPLPVERFRFGAVPIDKHIFVFGGRDTNDDLVCQLDVFNVVEETWTTFDNYEWANCTSDLAVFTENGDIYLVGGYSVDYVASNTVIKVVVRYFDSGEPSTFEYTEVASMNTPRGDHSCWSNGIGYALCMGGFYDDFQVALKSVEQYDIDSNTWVDVEDMITGRGDFALGYLNSRLTVVGGEAYDSDLGANAGIEDVEWYDVENGCWTSSNDLFDLPYKRFRFTGAVDEVLSRMYVFGGQSDLVDGKYYQVEDTAYWYQEIAADQTVDNEGTSAFSLQLSVAALVTLFNVFLLTVL